MRIFPYTAEAFAKLLLTEIVRLDQEYKRAPTAQESTRWTVAMKEWLSSIARQHGMRGIHTASDMSEFLLDLVWWHDGPPQGAVLACEMEWGNTRHPQGNPARVVEDFDKLLSVKAPFKLMLFDSYGNAERRTEMISAMDSYLQKFGDHRAGEQYLAIDVSPLPHAWLCKISHDSEDSLPKLSALTT